MSQIQDTWFETDKVFVGGAWLPPANGETLPIENPSTGETVGEVARGTGPDIDAAVAAAH